MKLRELMASREQWKAGYQCVTCNSLILRSQILDRKGVCPGCGKQHNPVLTKVTPCVYRKLTRDPWWNFWKPIEYEIKTGTSVNAFLFPDTSKDLLSILVLLTDDNRIMQVCSELKWDKKDKQSCEFLICTYDGTETYKVTFIREKIDESDE